MRWKVISRMMGEPSWVCPVLMFSPMLAPMGGMGQLKVCAMTSVAF